MPSTYSPTLYVYGYEIDQVKAIKYLVDKYPEWERKYKFYRNHFIALDAVAQELSQNSGLTLHSIPLWVGGHCISHGMVFYGANMAEEDRTPEDNEKLKILEELLVSMGISVGPNPKLGLVCSAACLNYPVEPPEMEMRSPPPGLEMRSGDGVDILRKEINERQSRLKQAEREERKKKERTKCGEGPTPDGEAKDSSTMSKKKRGTQNREKSAPKGEWDDSSTSPQKKRRDKGAAQKTSKTNGWGGSMGTVLEPTMRDLRIEDSGSETERAGDA
ncbi:hypothetical protein BDM02DRAFT_3188214 [Thelephora ganbajun]|uniref:Uncharacterized protein n=1 Tax=Thelephora ganbajun TaxID=370292 RepID=A0ACB6ZC03_THEGA|nr:hypothetical protein BDM02DRAFT_3188214 [Thelephora ganbajun]